MICPFCGFESQKTLNKRSTYKGSAHWRRRKCDQCARVFTTYEFINLNYIKVIKKSGEIRFFDRAKLMSGILIAYRNIKHMDSGDAAVLAEEITKAVEGHLISNQIKKITTHELITITTGFLKHANYTAMLNYVSYFVKPQSSKDIVDLL
jgi:transcriptional repressor NrdR